jgi:hypothetical protein
MARSWASCLTVAWGRSLHAQPRSPGNELCARAQVTALAGSQAILSTSARETTAHAQPTLARPPALLLPSSLHPPAGPCVAPSSRPAGPCAAPPQSWPRTPTRPPPPPDGPGVTAGHRPRPRRPRRRRRPRGAQLQRRRYRGPWLRPRAPGGGEDRSAQLRVGRTGYGAAWLGSARLPPIFQVPRYPQPYGAPTPSPRRPCSPLHVSHVPHLSSVRLHVVAGHPQQLRLELAEAVQRRAIQHPPSAGHMEAGKRVTQTAMLENAGDVPMQACVEPRAHCRQRRAYAIPCLAR